MVKVAKKKKGLKVDFSGTEVRILIPEDNYPAKVVKVTQEEGNEHDYLKWVFAIKSEDPKVNGQKVYTNTSLAPQALWNLRNLLETMGVETPDSEMDLDLDELVDLELIVRIEHEDFEGKMRARVSDYMPLEESAEADDEEEEEKPAKKPKKDDGKKPSKKEDDEEEEEEAEEDADEESEEEEEADAEESDEEESDEEEESEEEADEEEEATGISAAEVREMDDDELKDLVKKYELPVKLKAIPKASKRIAAVIDALEKAELLTEDE